MEGGDLLVSPALALRCFKGGLTAVVSWALL